MLEFVDLSYRYRNGLEALSHISASVGAGVHLLLGENGAGKTTLLHLASALLYPTEGRVMIDRRDTRGREPEMMRRVFFLPDNMEFPQRSLREFAADHSRFYPSFSEELLRNNLEYFELTGNEKFKSLSLGARRKTTIAYALALRPDVLLLDEPANGLDIGSKETLRRLIGLNLGDGQTVMVSTHTVGDLETLYDGVMILHRGKLVVKASTERIQRCLGFVSGAAPAADAIHFIQRAGVFHSVVPSRGELETAIDFNLLYFALQGPNKSIVLDLLNDDRNEE